MNINILNNVPLFADLSGYPLLLISPSSLPFDDYPTESSNNLINSNTLFMIISELSAKIYKNSENINTISAAMNNIDKNILLDIKKDIYSISAEIMNNINNNIDKNILLDIKKDIYSISAEMNNKIENIVVDNNKLLANFILIKKNNSIITLSMPAYIPTGIIEITDNGLYNYNMYATKQCSAAIALTENAY